MSTELSFDDFKNKTLSSDILFIDVRSVEEVTDGHIKAAYWAHIPRSEIETAFSHTEADFEVFDSNNSNTDRIIFLGFHLILD